jgi:DNA-binding LytR/AlgR family response regulator
MLIAICDDCKEDAEKIRFSLMDINDEMEMRWFQTGAELIESVRSGCFYSLIFQDVYLEKELGVDIAQAVKQASPDTQIIFVTTSLDHAVDAFKVQAVDYLVKPCTETEIVKAFARVNMRVQNNSPKPVVLNLGKEIHVFHPEQVVKLESDRHYVIISHRSGRTERIHMNYAEAAAQFGNQYIELRRGLLVNPMYIERIAGAAVLLTDGSKYILPRAKKDVVIAQYAQYMTGN